MAIPTFDFANLARISMGLILHTVKSPIFYFGVLMTSMGVIYNQLYNHFISLSIPTIPAELVQPHDHGGIVSYFLYMFNFDLLLQIFNAFISITNNFISFVPGIFFGLFIACRLYLAHKHVYQTVKDISKR